MSHWFCKKHGKSIYVPVCIHLKEGVESKRDESFNLIREELSQVDGSYLSTLLCDDCMKKIEVNNKSVTFFDPQIRKFEQSDDFYEEPAEYEGIFDKLDDKLVSICYECLLEVYPEYESRVRYLSDNSQELNKQNKK